MSKEWKVKRSRGRESMVKWDRLIGCTKLCKISIPYISFQLDIWWCIGVRLEDCSSIILENFVDISSSSCWGSVAIKHSYNRMSELAVKLKNLTDERDLIISLLETEDNDKWIVVNWRRCGVCGMCNWTLEYSTGWRVYCKLLYGMKRLCTLYGMTYVLITVQYSRIPYRLGRHTAIVGSSFSIQFNDNTQPPNYSNNLK